MEKTNRFPKIDETLVVPVFNRVVLQARHAEEKTSGGIILSDTTMDDKKRITSVYRVIAKGPLAFKDGEGTTVTQVEIGDYVIAGKAVGIKVQLPNEDNPSDPCLVHVCDDTDVICVLSDHEKVNSW